jgi:hypothetical protein
MAAHFVGFRNEADTLRSKLLRVYSTIPFFNCCDVILPLSRMFAHCSRAHQGAREETRR